MQSGPEGSQYNNIRQTGKFKPIAEPVYQLQDKYHNINCKVASILSINLSSPLRLEKKAQMESKMWRLYFQEPLSSYSRESLIGTVEKCFETMIRNHQVQQNKNADIFINVQGLLVQRMRVSADQYYPSNLDYNCMLVSLKVEKDSKGKQYRLECYQVDEDENSKNERQFQQQIYIKIGNQFSSFTLAFINNSLCIVKQRHKQIPRLQITDHNLQETNADIGKMMLVFNSISSRIIAIKFGSVSPTVIEPLQIIINNNEIFQYLLYKINRIKLLKYKVEESKEWHSFDQKLKIDGKKANKTTPQKVKKAGKVVVQAITLNKQSNQSTNFVQEQRQFLAKKSKGNMLSQTKPLKISQKVTINPKESNLVASELEYPASLNDQNDKDAAYIDDFQNLLFEDEGTQQKQLSLNDSFEEFQKKQNSTKNKEIMQSLNKRKQKEIQEQKLIASLKDKVGNLVKEEKDLINQNLTLKIEIKKLQKTVGQNQQFKQLEEMRNNINELKKVEKKLLQQLSGIKAENNIEVLVFGEPSDPRSSQSQRNSQKKIFSSTSGFPIMKQNQTNLTSSIRSDKAEGIFRQMGSMSPKSSIKGYQQPFNLNSQPVKQSYIPKGCPNPNSNNLQRSKDLNIYSSIPATQSYIQPSNNQMQKNQGMKFKIPIQSSNNCTPFNTPPASNKSLPDGPNTLSSGQSPMMISQLSEKKLKIPFSAGRQ